MISDDKRGGHMEKVLLLALLMLLVGYPPHRASACDSNYIYKHTRHIDFENRISFVYSSVSIANDRFFVMAVDEKYFFSSVDGLDWEKIFVPFRRGSLRTVVFHDPYYYAYTANNIDVQRSLTLERWEKIKKELPEPPLKIINSGDKLVAIPHYTGFLGRPVFLSFMPEMDRYRMLGIYYRDRDKAHSLYRYVSSEWESTMPIPQPRELKWTGDRYLVLSYFDGVYESYNAMDWLPIGPELTRKEFANSLAAHNAVTVVVGDHGLIRLLKEENTPWINVKVSVSADLYDVEWDGRRFIAVGDCGTVMVSADGEQWETLRTKEKERLLDVAYNGERYVAVGFGLTPEKGEIEGRILVSEDGRTWERVGPASTETVAMP